MNHQEELLKTLLANPENEEKLMTFCENLPIHYASEIRDELIAHAIVAIFMSEIECIGDLEWTINEILERKESK